MTGKKKKETESKAVEIAEADLDKAAAVGGATAFTVKATGEKQGWVKTP